ncbi:FtsX-like permease family protein [Clostridium gasigenes]|uniref:ABC transporter permease n=1 Tax=Clostridium gasigenes TaxID=94869 RepID=UPI001C0D75B5|nr:FtsX-like permease family protein [Clostridium gasigenes]MBU3136354.1 FtsX-like permease family protein [Clostridium gasigenes]
MKKNYILNLVFNGIKYQKKKYCLLFFGIILSVILCNCTLLIVKNIHQNQLKESIKSSGDYQFSFIDVKKELLTDLKKDNNVNQESISLLLLENENDISKIKDLRVDILHANKEAYKNILSKMEISTGRFPQTNKEVIMEEWVARRNNLNIGDNIEADINGQVLSFEIVGYYQNFISSQYKEKTNIYTLLDDVSERQWKTDAVFNIYLKLNSTVAIESNIHKYEDMVTEGEFKINKDAINLIEGSTGFNETDRLSIILLVPVIMISIIMILNVFNISITEKIKYFGMLKMIGASQRDIKKIVLLEAILLGLLAYPVGIIISITIVKWIIPLFNISYIIGADIQIFMGTLLISGIALIIIMIASAYFPARFAAKLVPLDALFQNRSIGNMNIKDKKNQKKYNIINNVIIDMASKNIKRNRKRYIVTIVAIMVSVSLVIVYSSFYSMAKFIIDKQTKEESMINTKIYKGENTSENDFQEAFDKISQLSELKSIYKIYNPIFTKSSFQDNDQTIQSNDTLIHIYDSKRFDSINKEKYFIAGKENFENIKNGNEIFLVMNDLEKAKEIKVGSNIQVDNNVNDKYKIGGVLNCLPYDNMNKFSKTTTSTKVEKVLIMNEKVAEKLFGTKLSLIGYDFVAKETNDLKSYKTKVMQIVSRVPDVKWVEYDDSKAKAVEMLNQMNILVMAFLSFIIFIAFLNLLNVISTNINTRRQEIGVLKAIGLSEKNIKLMIYMEGMICSFKGTLYGTVLSVLFVCLLKNIQMKDANWSIPLWIYIFPICFSIILGYFSALIPMRKINKSNIIELIKIEEC